MAECNVCVGKYNKMQRKKIVCPSCNYDACSHCLRKYILEKPEPRCMNPECAQEFPTSFLLANFPQAFINGALKGKRLDRLFEHEKTFFLETMLVIEENKRKQKIQIEINELEFMKMQIVSQIRQKRVEMFRNGTSSHTYQTICPNVGCQGMLNGDWVCGICECQVCKECHKVVGDGEHVCRQDDLDNVRFLLTETKPCPRCHASIQKTNGCDQMFCSNCEARFNWNTGKFIFGRFHNPEHDAFIRNARVPGDIECGGVPRYEVFLGGSLPRGILDTIQVIINTVNLVEHREILQLVAASDPPDNTDLRIRFIQNQINETAFKAALLVRDKNRQKASLELDVFQIFATAGADIVRRSLKEQASPEVVRGFLVEYKELIDWCNEMFFSVYTNTGKRSYLLEMHHGWMVNILPRRSHY